MGAAARELAFAPTHQELLIHREQTPPGAKNTFRIRLQVGAARDQIEIRHVRSVAVQQHNFFKAVISEGFRDVQDVINKMREVIVDCARKIHYMTGVTVADCGKDEDFLGNDFAGATSDLGGADKVHIQWKVRAVLFHRATWDNANLA